MSAKEHFKVIKFARIIVLLALGVILGCAGVERLIIHNLAKQVDDLNEVDMLKSATHAVSLMSRDRDVLLPFDQAPGYVVPPLSPILYMGVFGQGECGFASEVEVRLLRKLGFEAHILQILNDQGTVAHVVVECCGSQGCFVADPLFDHVYLTPDEGPIGIDVLVQNWGAYIEDCPNVSLRRYPFHHGMQRTNWKKGGAIGRFCYQLGVFGVGTKVMENISLREFFPGFYITRIIFIVFCLTVLTIVQRGLGTRVNLDNES